MITADKRPYSIGFASLWVPQTKVLGGNLGLSLGSSGVFSWAHGEVTGLINFEDTVQGWCFGDTMARAQLGWTRGRIRRALSARLQSEHGKKSLWRQSRMGRHPIENRKSWRLGISSVATAKFASDSKRTLRH